MQTSQTNAALTPAKEIASEISGPAWDNSTEYPSLNSNEFTHDTALVRTILEKIVNITDSVRPLMKIEPTTLELGHRGGLVASLQAISELSEHGWMLMWNLRSYLSTELSVDSKNSEALKVQSQMAELGSKFQQAVQPTNHYLARTSDDIVTDYLKHPHTEAHRFSLMRSRERSVHLLTEAEEQILTAYNTYGPRAWGELYTQLSSTLRCTFEKPDGAVEEISGSRAAAYLRDGDVNTRRAAWISLQNAWALHEESCTATLNNIVGWRIETYRRRSHTKPHHFLDQALHNDCVSHETLNAMLTAIHEQIEMPRKAAKTMASLMGKPNLEPWDILAPAPTLGGDGAPALRRSFKDGLQMVVDAFASVDSALGDFPRMMEKNRWLEGRVLPNKRAGAYCMTFAKSRTPRVFQTYMGSMSDIGTLAHELGHAYHAWVMRDMPSAMRNYPSTLAETASIFAETVLSETTIARRELPIESRYEMAWENASNAVTFLLNLPMRFELEKSIYEKRESAIVTPDELKNLASQAWTNWYGGCVTPPNSRVWQTTLHFSMSSTSFYNYSYTFGYLFSIGVYALRAKLGDQFMPAYIALLRDTGSMTAEALAQKHLGVDLREPTFWRASLAIVAGQVGVFEELIKEQGPTPLMN